MLRPTKALPPEDLAIVHRDPTHRSWEELCLERRKVATQKNTVAATDKGTPPESYHNCYIL